MRTTDASSSTSQGGHTVGCVVGDVLGESLVSILREICLVRDDRWHVALAHEPRLTLVVRGQPQVERLVVRIGDLYERHPPH